MVDDKQQLALFDYKPFSLEFLESKSDEDLFNLGAVAEIGTEILKKRGYSETHIRNEYVKRANPFMLSYMRGTEYLERKTQGARNDITYPQNEDKLKTSELVANEYNVSKATVERDAQLTSAINTIAETSPELKTEILQGIAGLTKQEVLEIAKEDSQTIHEIEETVPEKRRAVIATLHTGDNESYTPIMYLDSARLVMDGIDLDPASNDFANEKVKATTYYTEQTNGLDKEWNGKVWINPPYAYPLISTFIDKLISEIEIGNCFSAVLLTNNSADTKWFHKAAKHSSAICMTKGRINFYKADESITSPTNGQTFFYFGDDNKEFAKEFKKYGMIVEVVQDAD